MPLSSVLLVDDSAVMRMHVARTLRQAGYAGLTITQASDGEEALQHLQAHRFDLVISDLHMPRLDGLELVRRIRAAGLDVPVLLVTAEGSARKQTEAVVSGVTAYLTKPVTPDQLREKIEPLFAPGGTA
ncbi:MAG: response regulator [Planctomycetes bacterium]|nr:response regulator [Planctomycetota bacterium]